jgi:hypothetical protein
MFNFNISYEDLIKFPYFVDGIERRDKGVKVGSKMKAKGSTLHVCNL